MQPTAMPLKNLAKYMTPMSSVRAIVIHDNRNMIISINKVHFLPIVSTAEQATNGPKAAPNAINELNHAPCSFVMCNFSPGSESFGNVGELHVNAQPAANADKFAKTN